MSRLCKPANKKEGIASISGDPPARTEVGMHDGCARGPGLSAEGPGQKYNEAEHTASLPGCNCTWLQSGGKADRGGHLPEDTLSWWPLMHASKCMKLNAWKQMYILCNQIHEIKSMKSNACCAIKCMKLKAWKQMYTMQANA